MNENRETYEEINNKYNFDDIQDFGDEIYKYPDYQNIPEFSHNDNQSKYGKEVNIPTEMDYANNYTEYSLPCNDNPISTDRLSQKRCFTPDRISNLYNNYYNPKTNINYDLREEFSNPSTTRVNIKQRIYQDNNSSHPYIISNNNESNNYSCRNGEYIDNFQFHEIKNIKNKGFKKYDAITHIIGYSNLIPLNRKKNFYYNNAFKTQEDYQRNFNSYNNNINNNFNNNNNYETKKTVKTVEKIYKVKKNKNEYDEYLNNSKNLEYENMKREKIRQEQQRIKEEKLREAKMREEKEKEEELEKLKMEILKKENLKKEGIRNDYKRNFKVNTGRYKYKANIIEDIENYRNNTNFNRDRDNVKRMEIIHKNIKKTDNKIPIGNTEKTNNKTVYEYKSTKVDNINNNNISYNTSYKSKINKTISTTNTYRKNKNKNYSFHEKTDLIKKSNDFIHEYGSNSNQKLKSLLKVRQKTADLNFPGQYRNVDTYGENFDAGKYKREYINVKNVEDGKIENHIETGLSKDGQYLISVTSEQKISNINKGNQKKGRGRRIIKKKEKIEERNEKMENNYENESPEKEVQEIISTKTTKRKNLGDNYKYYESKHLYRPNITSFTTHRKRTERTVYGNEEHESRKVRTYKIRPKSNIYLGKKEEVTEETSHIPQ